MLTLKSINFVRDLRSVHEVWDVQVSLVDKEGHDAGVTSPVAIHQDLRTEPRMWRTIVHASGVEMAAPTLSTAMLLATNWVLATHAPVKA